MIEAMEKFECKLDRPQDAGLVTIVLDSDDLFENCDQIKKTAFLTGKDLENVSQSLKFGSAGKEGIGGLRFDTADGISFFKGAKMFKYSRVKHKTNIILTSALSTISSLP